MTREEAIKMLIHTKEFLMGDKICWSKYDCHIKAIDMAIEALSVANLKEEFESADAVQGEWIGYNADKEDWLRTDGTPIFLVCDKCHGTVINNGSAHWNFCPNCGARMTPYKGGDTE